MAPPIAHVDETNGVCPICGKQATEDDMVECTKCVRWIHYICARRGDSVAEDPTWICPGCNPDDNTILHQKDAPPSNSTPMSNNDRRSTILAALENSRARLIELNREAELLNQLSLLEEGAELQQLPTPMEMSPKPSPITTSPKVQVVSATAAAEAADNIEAPPPRRQHHTSHTPSHPIGVSTPILDPIALATRHTVGKDLPCFDGKPGDWVLFYTSYIQSNTMCSFLPGENLQRLRRAIKYPARKFVEGQLTDPRNIPTILNTLERLFGRPELVVKDLIEQVRALPAPREAKMDSIVQYASSIYDLTTLLNNDDVRLLPYRNNPYLVEEILSRLPNSIQFKWSEADVTTGDVVEFGKWLYNFGMKLCTRVPSANVIPKHTDRKPPDSNKRTIALHNVAITRNSEIQNCAICKGSCEKLIKCDKFMNASVNERFDMVKIARLCFCCLNRHKGKCFRRKQCQIDQCKWYHHPTLHRPVNQVKNTDDSVESFTHINSESDTRYRYIPIRIISGDVIKEIYAFLDEGSSTTLISQELADELNLLGEKSPLQIGWTDDSVMRVEEHSMRITLRVRIGSQLKLMKARTVSKLVLPTQSLNYERLAAAHRHLRGLPIQSYQRVKPGLLIGLDNWHLAVPTKAREGKEFHPIAVKCRLGWTISAMSEKYSENRIEVNIHDCHTCCQKDDDLFDLVKKFYTTDRDGVRPNITYIESKEDKRARNIMEKTLKRRADSRFEIGLLWRRDDVFFPESKNAATMRLKSLERSLRRKPEHLEILNKLIKEYETKGYIRRLTPDEEGFPVNKVFYVPIFLHQSPNKPKVRPIWDFAAEINGISLNSLLLSGPDLTASLIGVLFRFRQRKVAVVADIKEMFHRVWIIENDIHAQRFLWRFGDIDVQPIEFVMRVMSFGSTCSPSCAQLAKNTNAEEFMDKFPDAHNAIVKNHYVDDWLQSFDHEEEAIRIGTEVKEVHRRGGFEIRNWRSNKLKVSRVLGGDEHIEKLNLHLEDSAEKVLGMFWCPASDCFMFLLNLNKGGREILSGEKIPTKRELLRVLMSIYDPLGLIANYIVRFKILMQDVWRSKIDWDDPITADQNTTFQQCIKLFPKLKVLKIPRCHLIGISNYSDVDVQLHTFVDASEVAEAAVCYFRIERDGVVRCSLVAAKTHVAPLKLTSIPDLELESAVLGARLAETVKKHHEFMVRKCIYWTDSKVSLDRIRMIDLRKKKKFVAFRVAEIQDLTNPMHWRYVPSRDNVADDATKWAKIPNLEIDDRWYIGPSFLYDVESQWPAQDKHESNAEEDPLGAYPNFHLVGELLIKLERFSSLQKLRKTVAILYSLRYPDPVMQFQRADAYLHRIVQRVFVDEIAALDSGNSAKINSVLRKSPLRDRSPYLDQDGVLRVGGRIDKAEYVPLSVRRPVILPRSSHFTLLVVRGCHEKYQHAFHETVINEVRQQYDIPGLRSLLNKIKHSCVICQVRSPKIVEPKMGDLPYGRLAAYEPPFTYTGMDFLGPVLVTIRRSKEKRWMVLFTCLTTRAIHVEVAASLDTDSCVMCLRIFMNLRGQPREIRTDRGTNFIATERLLREEFKRVNLKGVARNFEGSAIKWIFNPPGAPHMGGAWERMVRTFKMAFYPALPTYNINDWVLRACIAEAIFIVNSRPLTHIPIEPGSSEVLTPNHFLIGSSNGVKSIGSIPDNTRLCTKGYITSQMFRNRLWKLWVEGYLPELVRRTKNFLPVDPMKPGDLVVVCDSTLPSNTWPKGVVKTVFPGKDGQVRSAVVSTRHGEYHRPVSKLALVNIRRGETTIEPESSSVSRGGENVGITPKP